VRAHERVQGIMAVALAEANAQDWKFAPITNEDE
jgi:hypothetical protein